MGVEVNIEMLMWQCGTADSTSQSAVDGMMQQHRQHVLGEHGSAQYMHTSIGVCVGCFCLFKPPYRNISALLTPSAMHHTCETSVSRRYECIAPATQSIPYTKLSRKHSLRFGQDTPCLREASFASIAKSPFRHRPRLPIRFCLNTFRRRHK